MATDRLAQGERLARMEALLETIAERLEQQERKIEELTALRHKGFGIMAALSVVCMILGAIFGGKIGALFSAMGK